MVENNGTPITLEGLVGLGCWRVEYPSNGIGDGRWQIVLIPVMLDGYGVAITFLTCEFSFAYYSSSIESGGIKDRPWMVRLITENNRVNLPQIKTLEQFAQLYNLIADPSLQRITP